MGGWGGDKGVRGILGYMIIKGGADNSRYPGVWEGGVLGYREGEEA